MLFASGILEPAAPPSRHHLSSKPACLHSILQLAVQLVVAAGQRVEALLEPRQVCQHLAPPVRLQRGLHSTQLGPLVSLLNTLRQAEDPGVNGASQ